MWEQGFPGRLLRLHLQRHRQWRPESGPESLVRGREGRESARLDDCGFRAHYIVHAMGSGAEQAFLFSQRALLSLPSTVLHECCGACKTRREIEEVSVSGHTLVIHMHDSNMPRQPYERELPQQQVCWFVEATQTLRSKAPSVKLFCRRSMNLPATSATVPPSSARSTTEVSIAGCKRGVSPG